MRKNLFLALALFTLASTALAAPETVLVTYRPQAGNAEKLEQLIARHGATLQRLALVTSDPHLTFRANDSSGKPIVIDLLTWKDDAIPDNAPAEVRAIWDEMQKLVEKRDGRPGIEILNVTPVKP
ncbi:MAG TPA: hypothetical protein VFE33_09465 [Thermoanaerobaculia bacterium]|nr:hypothetical protein [Thermoanaerobaculia bacterium]